MSNENGAILYVLNSGIRRFCSQPWERLPENERKKLLSDLWSRVTAPSNSLKYGELRKAILGSEMTEEQFITMADEFDFGNLPTAITWYLPFYFDPMKGKFLLEKFDGEYNNGNGPSE